MYKGIIFCQVESKVKDSHLRPSLTWGNQKYNGQRPSFILSTKVIIMDLKFIIKKLNKTIIKNKNIDEDRV
jgi:hypothetical protein